MFVEGERAGRVYDTTTSDGMLISGSPNVEIGSATFDKKARLKAAIARIKASPFGQTAEGKRVLHALERRFEEGRIDIREPRFGTNERGLQAATDPETGNIVYFYDGGSDGPDVENLARGLVHEGTHGKNFDDGRPNDISEEKEAWDNEATYDDDVKRQGSTRPYNLSRPILDEYKGLESDEERRQEIERLYPKLDKE